MTPLYTLSLKKSQSGATNEGHFKFIVDAAWVKEVVGVRDLLGKHKGEFKFAFTKKLSQSPSLSMLEF